ncbi:hypothetical protein KV113_20370, partial [Mycolicibacter sp. MYC340]|nr:hypothetical protein [Mycolicibacter sp. MYC340]
MAIFGRRSARQRLRSAARESLTIPAFSAPVDCSSWVLGGLWPAELATITPETAPLADYLNADLQRIANSANEKLHAIGRSDLVGQARQTAEARVINVARAFAVLRVESTVRQLHKEALEFRAEYASLNPAPPPVEETVQIPADPEPPSPVEPPREAPSQPSRAARHRMPDQFVVEMPEAPPAPEVTEAFDVVKPEPPAVPRPTEPVVIDHVDTEPPTTAMPVEPPVVTPVEPLAVPLIDVPEDLTAVIPAAAEPVPTPAPQPQTP